MKQTCFKSSCHWNEILESGHHSGWQWQDDTLKRQFVFYNSSNKKQVLDFLLQNGQKIANSRVSFVTLI